MATAWEVHTLISQANADALREVLATGEPLPAAPGMDGSSWVTTLASAAFHEVAARAAQPKRKHTPTSSENRVEVLRMLVEHEEPLEGADRYGRSALELAAVGDSALLEAMLAHGVDPSAVGPGGRPPLHAAAEAGHLASIEALLRAGADPAATDPTGRNAYSVAYREGHDEVADRLAAAGVAFDPATPGALHAAAVRGDEDRVKRCLAEGEPGMLNAKEPSVGWVSYSHASPLVLAAMHGRVGVLHVLLEAGADPNVDRGNTPLQYAVEAGNLGAVEILLDAGANPHAKYGNTYGAQEQAAHAAARFGHVEILRRLLDAGVKPMVRDSEGATLLHAAAAGLRPRCVELLLERGADPHRKGDTLNLTPRKLGEECGTGNFSNADGHENAAKRTKRDKTETLALLTAAEKAKPQAKTSKSRKTKSPPPPAAWRAEPFERTPPAFPEPAASEAVTLVQSAFGAGEPIAETPNVLRFHTKDASGVPAWIVEHHETLTGLGCQLIADDLLHTAFVPEAVSLFLLPSADPADAIAHFQAAGDGNVGPGRLAAAMKEMHEIRPLVLTSLRHDGLTAVFTRPTRSTTQLARFVADLCPDAASNPAEVAALAADLKESGRLLLWWD